MTAQTDPLDFLTENGITIAWAASMRWKCLWLPEERVVVLVVQTGRAEVAEEARRWLAEILAD